MLKNSSVSIAKNRLRTLVISDRVQCTPSAYEHICKDLYETLSKYMELTEDDFHVSSPAIFITICERLIST